MLILDRSKIAFSSFALFLLAISCGESKTSFSNRQPTEAKTDDALASIKDRDTNAGNEDLVKDPDHTNEQKIDDEKVDPPTAVLPPKDSDKETPPTDIDTDTNTDTDTDTNTDTDTEPQFVVKTNLQNFDLEKSHAEVRIIWALDNSGSMSQEAAHMRENMSAFISFVEKKSGIKVAIISSTQESTGFTLQEADKAKGHLQLPLPVGSKNALAKTKHALLEKTIAGKPTPLANPVKDFYSNETHNVLVVVTDDRSSTRAMIFQDFIESKVSINNFSFFAFAGKESSSTNSSCSIANEGVEYEKLAKATGGQVFDICATDWTAEFETLAESIIMLTSKKFLLEYAPKTIKAVSIDGQPLEESSFKIEGKFLNLMPEAADLAKNRAISIEYEYVTQVKK